MSDVLRPDWAGRLHALRRDLPQGIDAVVVSSLINITYLTGFSGSAGLLVVSPTDAWLIVDGRYDTAVREGIELGRIARVTIARVSQRYDLTLASILARRTYLRVAVEGGHVTLATLGAWERAAAGVTFVSTENLVEHQRLIKDAQEIATFRRAARALSDVARSLNQIVAAGLTERDVAKRIDAALDRAGFSAPAFPTIVASGPNSALPHAHPTLRKLTAGDLVVLDFGGVLDGYCVDLTRMAAIGQVPERGAALYEAVRDAQAAALGAICAGVAGSTVDAAARQVLDSRGLGDFFVHSTGHGLGLEVHEAPRLARPNPSGVGAGEDDHDRLEAGMVCTIEPGAYLEGFGGVRLEDDVLVTAEGADVLTDAPPDLVLV
jgi:Xaa-Pro aminopeptidase